MVKVYKDEERWDIKKGQDKRKWVQFDSSSEELKVEQDSRKGVNKEKKNFKPISIRENSLESTHHVD